MKRKGRNIQKIKVVHNNLILKMYELLNLDRKDMEMSIINGDATADSILPILLSGFMRDINAGAIIEEMSDVDDMSLADPTIFQKAVNRSTFTRG